MSLIIPPKYKLKLLPETTEMAIKMLKDAFQERLSKTLNLRRVTAPLFVLSGTGLNDDLMHEVIRLSGMNLIIDDTDHPLIIKVASIQSARMQVYFIDNDDYFQNRLQVTDENGEEYEDNDARAIFYARGVLETVKKLRWCPDIIHCHGWMTALAPLYIKKVYKDEPSFRDAKVIFSLYEDDFKQPFHADFSNKLLLKGIAKKDIAGLKEPIDYTALCKLAADFSDGIIQQSEHVNEEVLNYARESGKPVLEYQSPENFAEACNDFYDKVWETEQK